MGLVVQLRWGWLTAALLCALAFAAPMVVPYSQSVLVPIGYAMYATLPFQLLGAVAMHKRHGRGGAVVVAYLAALFWLIGLAAAAAAVSAGPGGMVYGILIVLPAIAVAGLLQIAAFLMLVLKERGAPAHG